MTGAARFYAAAFLLLIGGCNTGGGDWAKTGADNAAAAAAYQDCRGLSDTAVETDRAIDQDILASRQNDWQRASLGHTQTQLMNDHTRDRAGAIVESCMKAKGFSRKP
ncbi:MAG: hypothetical protein JO162_09670 [Alphaproteobacteria bacterium]|nr:hypothetical protein [Alphaproteobacteria bacterium]MBV9967286.1 hypothetical protein [Alphaproteobacteria bacterium]